MAGKIVIVVWLVVLAIAPFPLAYAQQPKKVPRGIGFLSFIGRSNSPAPNIEAFRQGLRDLGYVEGENIVIEHRNAEGNRLSDLAAELIRLKVDIIVAQSTTGLVINYHSAECPDVCNS